MFTQYLQNKAAKILEQAAAKNLKLVTAESCTGGLLSALFTEISGSSKVFERGFLTYSNAAKTELLGVEEKILQQFGAVSAQCAQAMVDGALKNSHADIAIAVTGIAGPDGGSQEKPVGLVYIAVGCEKNIRIRKFNFSGSRSEVRKSAVIAGLEMVLLTIA